MATSYSARSRAIEPHVMARWRANELQAAGHDVIHLEIGEPDFTTAEPIVEAGRAALAAGHTRYTAARGLPALREAIAKFYGERYGVDLDPQRVLVTRAAPAPAAGQQLAGRPRPPLVARRPGLPVQQAFPAPGGRRRATVPVGPDSRYQLTPDLIERHWDSDSVGALVATPANPTGTLLDRDELAGLSGALKARGGHLVVDEIYHGLTYGVDAASVLEVDDDAFVLNSFSKYFGMTGWRLGWLVAPAAAVPELEKLAQNLYISAPSMAQQAALACFEPTTIAILEERREEFARRRDFLLPALRELGFRDRRGAGRRLLSLRRYQCVRRRCLRLLQALHRDRARGLHPGLDFGRHQAGHHVSPIPRTCRACRKRWSGSPAA